MVCETLPRVPPQSGKHSIEHFTILIRGGRLITSNKILKIPSKLGIFFTANPFSRAKNESVEDYKDVHKKQSRVSPGG